jgi:signal peptidase I
VQSEGNSSITTAPAPSQVADLRKKAVFRSYFCTGSGFAFLGRRRLAEVSYACYFLLFAAALWLSYEPAAASAWTAVAVLGLFLSLTIIEQIVVRRAALREPGPDFLTKRFAVATTLAGVAVVAAIVVCLVSFRSSIMAGSGMAPTLPQGSRMFYHTRVDPQRLRRGAPVVYALSPGSAWGQPGMIMVGRILAEPGDRLSVRGGRYVVNGEVSRAVGGTAKLTAVIDVPPEPGAITVPEGEYFCVQDDPKAFDSRVLSWIREGDVVGTRLFHLNASQPFQPVE